MRCVPFLVSLPALAALLASQPGLARAQSATPASEDDSTSSDARPPAPVFYETTTVTAQPVSSATGGVSVLDSREIDAQASRSLADVVREVPGLDVLGTGGRAGITNAWVRGSDPNFTLVLLDGIPLNDATELQGGAVNLEELPVDLVDHVEVVRGPLTAFYGTNALAGVIQLFTPRGGPGPLRVRTGLEAGDAALRHAFGRVSGPVADGGYAAGASWDEESHRVGEDRFRQLDLFGSADLRLGASGSLALTGRLDDGTTDDYPDASGGPVYGDGLLRHTDHRDLDLGARFVLGDQAGRAQRMFVGFARRDLDRTSPAVAPIVPESVEHTLFSRLRLEWQMPLVLSAKTELDVGLAGEGEWGDNTSLLTLPAALGGGTLPGDYVKDRETAGVFAGGRHQLGAVLLEAAVRADVATGGPTQANPHAGFVWRLAGGTRLRASAGRASKLPSFFALASPRALGGNPALRPEHVWGGEVGLEHSVSTASLDLGATYYRQELHDLIDFDFDSFQNVNRSRVRTQGVELSARWQALRSLAIAGEATYLDARDLSGVGLLQVPRWTGGGRITWRPVPRALLRVQLRGSSGYLDRQYPVPERDSVAGYGLVGAAFSWRFASGLVLRGRADNLADRRYETLIGFPGPGRSFWLGVGWDRS